MLSPQSSSSYSSMGVPGEVEVADELFEPWCCIVGAEVQAVPVEGDDNCPPAPAI